MPIGNDAPFVDANGDPLSGGLLYFYAAGSTTPQDTYTTSAGSVANANPVVLNSNGYPASGGSVVQIWGTTALTYKAVLKTSAGVTVWSRDNISPINDTSSTTDEWSASGLTPTYVSTTQFTLTGDQTSAFHVGRRLKFTVTAGTVYGRITVSAYTTLTTVTVAMDGSQTLDSGLSAVSYAVLRNDVLSIPFRVATASGTDTYTASVGATRLVAGDEFRIKFTNANTSTTPTFNPDSLGAKTMKSQSGGALSAGQINGEHTLRYNGTDMIVLNAIASAALPRSYLAGCGLTNGTDATNDIDIAAGACRDSTNAMNITCAALTKQLDAGWVAGTNQGMRNSAAAIANTTYHLYAVAKADGTQDYYAHTSITVATVITALQAESGGSAYLYARRIGSIIRSGATILAFSQVGDEFLLVTPVLDVDTTNPGTSAVTSTLTVPAVTVRALINVVLTNTGAGGSVLGYVSSTDQTDSAPSATAAPGLSVARVANAAGNVQHDGNRMQIRAISSQIRYRLSFSDGSCAMRIVTLGWLDRRGRDD